MTSSEHRHSTCVYASDLARLTRRRSDTAPRCCLGLTSAEHYSRFPGVDRLVAQVADVCAASMLSWLLHTWRNSAKRRGCLLQTANFEKSNTWVSWVISVQRCFDPLMSYNIPGVGIPKVNTHHHHSFYWLLFYYRIRAGCVIKTGSLTLLAYERLWPGAVLQFRRQNHATVHCVFTGRRPEVTWWERRSPRGGGEQRFGFGCDTNLAARYWLAATRVMITHGLHATPIDLKRLLWQ